MLAWRAMDGQPFTPKCFLELLRYWDSTGEKRKVQRDMVKKSQGQNSNPKTYTPSTPSSLDPGGGKCQGRQREGELQPKKCSI